MTNRIPFPLPAVDVLFIITGPHRHSRRFPGFGITLCGQNTSTHLYGCLRVGVRKLFKKIDELLIQLGAVDRGLTTQGVGFYGVVFGDHECQKSRYRTKTPLQKA